ncbi:hypothetical protein BGZ94_002817 [Podila epigama]|nr:hypothetical protein BGZ94_002817 [Podila epigama]
MHCHGIVCTVFSIHQILNAICAHLGRVDLARCTRVSRCLHKTFTPPLWRTLRISHRNYTQLLATHADVFVQCVGHTRELDFWGAAPSVRVLERFLQADANRGLLVNTLTTLRIQSIVGTTGIQTLALLLQRNCARLVNLEMVSLPAMLFLTPIVDTVLTTSLRLQKQLRTLKIKGATPMSTYTLAKLLRACPPQLEVLTIDHPLSTKPMTTPLSHSGLFLQSDALDATPRDNSTSPKDSEDPTHSQFWALSHHTNIHTLELPMTIPKDQYPFMTHFLRHCCPKLESWRVSRMLANNQDHDAKDVIDGLTSVLKRHCPHLKRLQFEHIQEQTEPFYIEIIQACAPSSLEALSIEGYIGQVDGIMETLRICGHFASLREVQVSGIGASVVQTRGEAGGHEDGENMSTIGAAWFTADAHEHGRVLGGNYINGGSEYEADDGHARATVDMELSRYIDTSRVTTDVMDEDDMEEETVEEEENIVNRCETK